MLLEKQLTKKLIQKKLTIAAAESCSGGYISYLLTKTPGSSRIFKGSIVSYALSSKTKLFKINPSLLKKDQGVSEKICRLMAQKVKKIFTSDIGISIVGFAGPTAKINMKPGTVFIGIAQKNHCVIKKAFFTGKRNTIRKNASKYALQLLYTYINESGQTAFLPLSKPHKISGGKK